MDRLYAQGNTYINLPADQLYRSAALDSRLPARRNDRGALGRNVDRSMLGERQECLRAPAKC